MALVRRVNNSFGFVLNTIHCKCIVNIKGLKRESDIMRYSNLAGAEILDRDYRTFAQMIKFRQTEAKKSVIIKISEVGHIEHLKKFCEYYAKIVNVFPYNTIDNNRFVLMECSSQKDVEALRNIAVCKADPEYAHSVTPFFLYKPRVKLSNQNTLNKDSYEYHSNFVTPNLNKINQSLKKIQSVSNQMIFLYDTLRITELNIRLRFYTATQISYYLSQLFVNLSVVPFGSSVNGFGQIGCDLDLLCKTNIPSNDTSGWKKFLFLTQIVPFTDRVEQKHFLDVIGTIIKTCMPGVTDVKKILEARVPIIKFRNLNTNMQCDLCSTNMTALHMSELLYLYGQLDWRVKPLVFTIRKWARSMNLTKENPGQWITNFSLTLLILFYLQTKHILPSLSSIKIFRDKSNTIDNFDWFLKWKNSVSNNDESLSKLLFEFFEYYCFFDFKTHALCLRDGITKLKKDASPLYIYNPFNPSLNVSKNVTLSELLRLVGHFQRASQIMLNSTEQDTLVKLINFDSNSTINGFNRKNKLELISEKFIPNVTNTNNLQKIEKNIIK
ncbi:poly(A) RNA polymerase, mitochondrial [Frieseomelitta varia]|uniref:poly(A) RNA polymerase, mitochondrial n=1 Tax=Frieseomelitta varia TaxID=561572 RepID=UPI001CB699BA|nr:poly(A) RNA polymerase, mitochondrial [Frieseomelitta varia]